MLSVLKEEEIILLIDDTGDWKKGNTTDYVKRQYVGNVGKIENGIVAVTAYALYEGMVFPLCFAVYKPRERLKPLRGIAAGELEEYRSKPQIAAQMIRDLLAMGFRIRLVLADSAYGESASNFVNVLVELHLPYILAIRSKHACWLPETAAVDYEAWQTFERIFSNDEREVRYMREIIYGQRQAQRFWQITTHPDTRLCSNRALVGNCHECLHDGQSVCPTVQPELPHSSLSLCPTSLVGLSTRVAQFTQQSAPDHSAVHSTPLLAALGASLQNAPICLGQSQPAHESICLSDHP
jgi:SRSO17 transposase